MPKLARETRSKVRAVEDALAHYSLEGDNVQASLEALHELLETDKVFLYALAQRPDAEDLMVARDAAVTYPRGRMRKVFDEYLRGRGAAWGVYNAIRPEPLQRDRVLSSEELAKLTEGRSVAIEEDLYRRLGTFGEDTMRVLVCDGPSLLAWVGFMQPDKATERQRELLERLIPAFRRRLEFERLVGESSFTGSALAAALEQVNAAAWMLGPNGRLMHANAAGRARFDRDPADVGSALEACVVGRADSRFKVTPLRDAEGRGGHIVVELPQPGAGHALPDVARRFGLTPAQTRVLERVARGISNATIAAELGVAERTVEAHVTAILVKAQVPSRAALIVQIFRDRMTA
jgi:DNA-binding CsgD family transcriptional regulator